MTSEQDKRREGAGRGRRYHFWQRRHEQGQAETDEEKRAEARKRRTAGMPPDQAEAARNEVAGASATPWLDEPVDEGILDPEVARDLNGSGPTPERGPPAASDGKRKPYRSPP
jgi:hypothetical protein